MRLWIYSDLHIESINNNVILFLDSLFVNVNREKDVIILAGDIYDNTNSDIIDILTVYFKQFKNKIIIKGNHDCWKIGINKSTKFAKPRFVKVLGDIKFICATLWSDISNISESDLSFFNDHKKIPNFSKTSILEQNKKDLSFIVENLDPNYKNIVVSHFSPSFKSCDSQYKTHKYNDYFHNSYDSIIKESNIKLWVHGHTHKFMDYYIGTTRVFCNPVGRPSEKNSYLYKNFIDFL